MRAPSFQAPAGPTTLTTLRQACIRPMSVTGVYGTSDQGRAVVFNGCHHPTVHLASVGHRSHQEFGNCRLIVSGRGGFEGTTQFWTEALHFTLVRVQCGSEFGCFCVLLWGDYTRLDSHTICLFLLCFHTFVFQLFTVAVLFSFCRYSRLCLHTFSFAVIHGCDYALLYFYF